MIKRRLNMAKGKTSSIGAWAFLIGVVLVLIIELIRLFGIMTLPMQNAAVALLVIAGILVGLLNVTGKETYNFLLASLALVLVSFTGSSMLSSLGTLGGILSNMLASLLVLFVPTTIVVALKSVFVIAKD